VGEIWSARHNHKSYGETEPYFLLDQSRARIFSVVYGYGYGYGRPVETLLYHLPSAILRSYLECYTLLMSTPSYKLVLEYNLLSTQRLTSYPRALVGLC
jgi:hypothetical protein